MKHVTSILREKKTKDIVIIRSKEIKLSKEIFTYFRLSSLRHRGQFKKQKIIILIIKLLIILILITNNKNNEK